jgi:hypothetical protein
MFIQEYFKENKDVELSNESIKTIINKSRFSLGEIIDKIKDRNTQEEIIRICQNFYDANEKISLDGAIEESTKKTVIDASEKIEMISKDVVFDKKTGSIVSTIANDTSLVIRCFKSQKAPA